MQRIHSFCYKISSKGGFPGGAGVKNPPANAGDARDVGSVPGLGRSPGGGHGSPTSIFLPGESQDRGALWATAHRVTKSHTRLKRLGTHTPLA